MKYSAQDCKGTVVSWTDCLSPQSVPDPHVKHVKNTTKKVVDDSRYQYVVELTFTDVHGKWSDVESSVARRHREQFL